MLRTYPGGEFYERERAGPLSVQPMLNAEMAAAFQGLGMAECIPIPDKDTVYAGENREAVVYLYMRMCPIMRVCMYVCTYICKYVCMYVCMVVCMYGCMYVCMVVCMYVCMHIYVCIYVCLPCDIYIIIMYACMSLFTCNLSLTANDPG